MPTFFFKSVDSYNLLFRCLTFHPVGINLHVNPLGLSLNTTVTILLGSSPTGTRTIALDPTFGSFTLLELVSH